jgi:DnaK suppressor protein
VTRKEQERYRVQLLALHDRLTDAIERMSETVRTDAQPVGEHDQHVSESSDTELVLEQDEESIRRHVLEALRRLDEGNFGSCQACGHSIGRDRLKAMPYTPFCVACERKLESAT